MCCYVLKRSINEFRVGCRRYLSDCHVISQLAYALQCSQSEEVLLDLHK